jgi:hypothetical protein
LSGSTSFSEKLVQGTTQRFSTPSQRRQCGDFDITDIGDTRIGVLQLDENLVTAYGGRAGAYRGKGDLVNGFCLLSIFFNLISIGIAAVRARPRPSPLPSPRAAPGVLSSGRSRVSSSITRPMKLFFASRGRMIPSCRLSSA